MVALFNNHHFSLILNYSLKKSQTYQQKIDLQHTQRSDIVYPAQLDNDNFDGEHKLILDHFTNNNNQACTHPITLN